MDDYISREALIKAVEGNPYVTDSIKSYLRCTAKNIPAADVVEVVRCGACVVYRARRDAGDDVGFCLATRHYVPDDGFCAWGERKDEKNHDKN